MFHVLKRSKQRSLHLKGNYTKFKATSCEILGHVSLLCITKVLKISQLKPHSLHIIQHNVVTINYSLVS